MNWLDLREDQFDDAIKKADGLCIIPVGCFEMHGQHMPVGSDTYEAIAVAEKGEACFSRIYTVDEGKTLSYPYAVEIDKKLYIAYSSTTEGYNRNSAELLIVDIEDLK